MKKWMLAGLGLLLVLSFAVGAYAITIENETVASGTTAIPINGLRGAYKILTVHPWTQDIIVYVLDKDSNFIEDYTVEAGSWRNVDISSMGSVIIYRAVATAVDWGVSVDRDAAIGGSSSQGANVALMTSDIDTLRILLAQPEQRTTSQFSTISEWSTSDPTTTKANCISTAVSGCRALLIDIEWDDGTADFAWEYYFTMSSGDSTGNKFGVWAHDGVLNATGVDTLAVDESAYPDDHFTYEIPLGGSVAAGYLCTRVHAGADLVGVTVTVFMVW